MADDPKLVEVVTADFLKHFTWSRNTCRAAAETALAAINASGTHWVAPTKATPKMRAEGLEEACVEDPRTIIFTWETMRTAYLAKTETETK